MSYTRFWNLNFHLFFLVLSRFQDWSSTYVLLPFVCIIHVILWRRWFLGGFGQEGLKFLQILLQLNTALVLIRSLIWTSKPRLTLNWIHLQAQTTFSPLPILFLTLPLFLSGQPCLSSQMCRSCSPLVYKCSSIQQRVYMSSGKEFSVWGSLYILYHHIEDVNPALVFSSFCTVTGIIYLQPELLPLFYYFNA